MLVTISLAVVQQMLLRPRSSGSLFGQLIDDGDVAQIRGIDETHDTILGSWVFRENLSLPTDMSTALANRNLLLLVSDIPNPRIAAYRWDQSEWRALPSMLVRLHADYAARLNGLFEIDDLQSKRVAVIGLGAGGSTVAAYLARCGVGAMRLIDFDRLETHNIARHVCSLNDIGRYKTRAVRDLLYAISPLIKVETFEADILADDHTLRSIVSGCDLVVAATDSEPSKMAINRICWPRNIPVVYAAAYNRAFGGDVFRALPPESACYDCFQQVVTEYFGPPPPAKDDLSPGYADPGRMADLIAEPGLAMDVAMIALIMARVSLTVLLRSSPNALSALPENWVLFGNRPQWIFEKPLESLFIDVPRQADCPTCNYDNYVHQTLHVSSAEAQRAVQELLAQIPQQPILDSLLTPEAES